MTRIVGLCLGLLISITSFAASQTVAVQLNSIKAIDTQDRSVDEVYLDITEYPSKGLPSNTRVPRYPMYWPSSHLEKITNIEVWKKALAQGESVTLLIALIDQDAPPWNTDDLIGEVKLQLKNENGSITSKWSVPNREQVTPTEKVKANGVAQFELNGDSVHYQVSFSIK